MSQNLQNVARFQKFQLDNLVDFEKCCKTRIFLQKSVPIQPKTSNILPKFCQKLATTLRVRRSRPPKGGPPPASRRSNVARFRLYRHRFLQENMRFAAFFKIYQILKLKFLKFDKILQILRHLQFFCWNFTKIADFSNRFFAKILRSQRCKRMQIL